MIKVKDIVLHTLSGLYYRCENTKMERWMNMNPYYVIPRKEDVPSLSYFYKNK
jgi:hypothetical protein